jgi:hypothetical protein
MHLPMEINNGVIEGLVDIGASMSVMVASIVRELGIMHLVLGHETYKTPSGIVTIALGGQMSYMCVSAMWFAIGCFWWWIHIHTTSC